MNGLLLIPLMQNGYIPQLQKLKQVAGGSTGFEHKYI